MFAKQLSSAFLHYDKDSKDHVVQHYREKVSKKSALKSPELAIEHMMRNEGFRKKIKNYTPSKEDIVMATAARIEAAQTPE